MGCSGGDKRLKRSAEFRWLEIYPEYILALFHLRQYSCLAARYKVRQRRESITSSAEVTQRGRASRDFIREGGQGCVGALRSRGSCIVSADFALLQPLCMLSLTITACTRLAVTKFRRGLRSVSFIVYLGVFFLCSLSSRLKSFSGCVQSDLQLGVEE